MKRCVNCQREFPDSGVFCPHDGGALEEDRDVIGRVLDGKYRIDSKISAGGMGTVYRATHVLMESICAVKIMHDSMMSDPQAVSRFQREAKAAARIRHPNAVAVMDFGITTDQIVYLVMELFDGRSLRQELRDSGPFPLERAAIVLERAAAALAVAHEMGVVHRDVKPDNIMVKLLASGEEEVKVLDFGIAKLKDQSAETQQLTNAGMVIGTPNYLSPEQCRAAELDARSDIYALAIVAYELLCGEVPFSAPTALAVAMMHTTQPPSSLVEKVPDLPQLVEDVIFKALAKMPADRYESVVDFAREFAEAAIGHSTVRGTAYIGGFSAGPGGLRTSVFTSDANTNPGARLTGASAMVPGTGQTTRVGGAPSEQTGSTTSIPLPPPTTSSKPMLMWGAVGAVALALAAGGLYAVMPKADVTPPPPPTNTAENPPTTPVDVTDMVLIPAGTFKMGRDSKDPAEGPAHDVSVASFYLDKNEVTNEQYKKFVEETSYKPPSTWANGTYSPGEDDFPVTGVGWVDARAYAKWAGKRLPSEAEWEYAARGPEGRLYPWGDEKRAEAAHTKEGQLISPQPVGSLAAGVSPFGIYDMIGNVWEWCEDGFATYPGSGYTVKPEDAGTKIIRGGSFDSTQSETNLCTRIWVSPHRTEPSLGFRCAKNAT